MKVSELRAALEAAGADSKGLKAELVERLAATQRPRFTRLLAAVLAGLAGRSGATDVFWVSLVANWRVWLPAQLLNYALVPPHLRVLFGNAVSICWNMTLAARIATGLAD